MKDYAVLTNDGKYTIFEFNNQRVRFITSDKLGWYTKIVEMNMDDIEIQIVSDYYNKNKEFMEEADAEVLWI